MIATDLAQTIRDQVADDLDISLIAPNRIEVFTPFTYQDGDHCGFYFNRRDDGEWEVTDEGEVLSHASYAGVDLLSEGRADRFRKTIEFYGMNERDGELYLAVPDSSRFGEAFYRFSQACLDLAQLTKLPAERRARTDPEFKNRVSRIIASRVPDTSVVPKWSDPVHDPNRVYIVDYRITAKRHNLFVFGVASDMACLRAAVSCLHYKERQLEFTSVAIYKDESDLHASATTPLDEAVNVKFSSIDDEEEIAQFFEREAA